MPDRSIVCGVRPFPATGNPIDAAIDLIPPGWTIERIERRPDDRWVCYLKTTPPVVRPSNRGPVLTVETQLGIGTGMAAAIWNAIEYLHTNERVPPQPLS